MSEYRVSARVVLRPGDKFRVSGGPYYLTASGEKIPLAVRGVCEFVGVTRDGSKTYITARTKEGSAVLHVEGRRRNRTAPEVVCRPYKIKSKLRRKKK